MGKKHSRTLVDIFFRPTKANIVWDEIVSMLAYLGAEVTEGSGSRVRFFLNGEMATFHRPHPQKEAKKYQVEAFREFLENAGVTPDDE